MLWQYFRICAATLLLLLQNILIFHTAILSSSKVNLFKLLFKTAKPNSNLGTRFYFCETLYQNKIYFLFSLIFLSLKGFWVVTSGLKHAWLRLFGLIKKGQCAAVQVRCWLYTLVGTHRREAVRGLTHCEYNGGEEGVKGEGKPRIEKGN